MDHEDQDSILVSGASRLMFMVAKIEWEDAVDQRALDLGFWRAEVEGIIKQAMEELYGGIGSNIWNVNILAIEVNPLRAVLAVPSRASVAVRAALTLIGTRQSRRIRISISKISPYLPCLAA